MTRANGIKGRFICPHPEQSNCTVVSQMELSVNVRGVIDGLVDAPNANENDIIWIPGFVDTHVHYPQHRVRAQSSGALLPWLEQTVFPEEAKFVSPAYAREVAHEFCDALLKHGTTCAQVFSSSDETATDQLFETLHAKGLRAQAGLTLMDQGAPDALCVSAPQAEKAIRRLVKKWHGADDDRLRFVITPRFALSCSPQLLRLAGDLSQALDLPVQTHLSENTDEIEAVRQMFPQHLDYLNVYEDFNLAHERTIFAHTIHLSDDEWSRLEHNRCAISHCPDSNNFLGSGQFPWRKAAQFDVRIGLGSDVGAGRTYAIRKVASSAYDVALAGQSRKTPSELLWHATRGGALAVNRSEVGCIAPGFECDLVGLRVEGAAQMTDDALFDAILFRDEVSVQSVFVRGKQIFNQAG